MRSLILGLLLVLAAACTRTEVVAGPEIAAINPVIGDASFVALHGRAPAATDDPTERIRTHLAFVEAALRGRDVAHLSPALRAARTRALDHLRAYWQRGEFPSSDARHGLLPTFVDDGGVRCAVAYLAEQALGAAPIEAINARYRNAYIAQIDAPALRAWAETSGLTGDELAMIQPAYPPRYQSMADFSLTVDYRVAVADDRLGLAAAGAQGPIAPEALTHLGMVRGDVRWQGELHPMWGAPIYGLTGGVGGAAGGHLAYDAHLVLGTTLPIRSRRLKHTLGATAGFGVDAIGERVARAWTVPVDAFYLAGRSREGSMRFGIMGGPRFAVAGTERRTGWHGGLAVVARDVVGGGPRTFRDVRVELGYDRIADTHFVGLSLTFATRSRFGWWEEG